MAVEFDKPGKKVLVTVNPQLSHGFAYADADTKLDDYFPGDTLLVEQSQARAFIAQGWVVEAAPGAKPGRAKKEEPKQDDPKGPKK